MNMETKKQIFERYKTEYYKARGQKKGGRKRCGEILDGLGAVVVEKVRTIFERKNVASIYIPEIHFFKRKV